MPDEMYKLLTRLRVYSHNSSCVNQLRCTAVLWPQISTAHADNTNMEIFSRPCLWTLWTSPHRLHWKEKFLIVSLKSHTTGQSEKAEHWAISGAAAFRGCNWRLIASHPCNFIVPFWRLLQLRPTMAALLFPRTIQRVDPSRPNACQDLLCASDESKKYGHRSTCKDKYSVERSRQQLYSWWTPGP